MKLNEELLKNIDVHNYSLNDFWEEFKDNLFFQIALDARNCEEFRIALSLLGANNKDFGLKLATAATNIFTSLLFQKAQSEKGEKKDED